MTPIEALDLALSKEEQSIKLYSKLSIEHLAIKELLDFLANEEEKHKLLIEKKIAELKNK